MEHWPRGKPRGDDDLLDYLVDWLLDLLGLDDIADAIADAFEALADAVAGIPVAGGPLAGFLNGIAEFVRGTEETAQTAQQGVVDNSAAISEIQSGLSGAVGGSGFTYSYPFDGSALDANWTTYDPNGTGTQVGGGQVEPDDNAVGNIFHLMETALPGDDFDVSFTLGDNNSHGTECTGVCFRSNTDMTDFGRLYTFEDEMHLGRSTRPSSSSNSVTTYDWGSAISLASDLSPGKIVRVTGIGTTYKVYVNGALVRTHTNIAGDPGGLKNVGASYRHTGLQQEYDSALFHGRSAGVAHFTAADITAPTYTGAGWHLYRSSSSASTSWNWTSTAAVFGATVFDTTDIAANVTVNSQGVGRIQVSRAGWYSISMGLNSNASPRISAGVALMMGAATGSMTAIRFGEMSDADTGQYYFTGNWVVWIPAGYYVQPAAWKSSTQSTAVSGDAAGSVSFFDGALMS